MDESPIKINDDRRSFPLCYGITHRGELRRFVNHISEEYNCYALELVDDVNFGLPQEAWTIVALHQAAQMKRAVHFNLNFMQDIENILISKGSFANKLTSKELRYVYQNWKRFRSNVIFWKDDTPCKEPW